MNIPTPSAYYEDVEAWKESEDQMRREEVARIHSGMKMRFASEVVDFVPFDLESIKNILAEAIADGDDAAAGKIMRDFIHGAMYDFEYDNA